MPSYIEIDQNLNFPSSSGAGKVIFGVNTTGQATITDNTGNTTVIGTGVGGSEIPMHPQVITSNITIPNNYNALLLGDVQISGSLAVGSGSNLSVFELDQNPTASYAVSASYAPYNPPYKVYTALLKAQFLNSNWTVTVTVLENTLGNITFTANNSTDLEINSSGLFIQNKTAVFYTAYTGDGGDTNPAASFNRLDNDTIILNSAPGLDYISLAPIEIRVYN